MDDLQLLDLLERAQKKQKGPQGEPGVSVEKIEQYDDDSFTIHLTNGFSKKVQLFPGKDGDTGPQGVQGEKGDVGAEGKAGRPGADALPGAPGRDGAPGVSVDTVVVNSTGDLLLRLTDSTIINCGRVVGPAGPTGAPGPTGSSGTDGKDGAAVLTGPRAPQESDGKEGDTWIDVSSAEFGFYKKSGNGWSKLANLRQPAKDTRVGAGAGGSAGGGKLQNTATLPLANPTRNSKSLPDTGNLKSQSDYNNWLYTALEGIVAGGGGGGIVDLSDYATIKYVDDSIAAIPATDLSDYATEVYVDEAIEAIDDKIDKLPPHAGQYVTKKGGDTIQGPLTVQAQGSDGRASNKVVALGLFSNSEGSALRLGTTVDRVYVGHNDVSINGLVKVDEIEQKSTDGDGIQINSPLHFNKPDGNSIFDVKEDSVQYQRHVSSITQLHPREIINSGILDNLMRDPSEYGYLTPYATKEYVDNAVSRSGLPVYRFANVPIEGLRAGEFVCFKEGTETTTDLGWIRAIAWKGVDKNGNRPMRDVDAITWDGNLNSTFSLLINDSSQVVLRAAMSQVVNGHPKIGYIADYDVYCVEWTGGDTTTITSNITKLNVGETLTFHCPELFF